MNTYRPIYTIASEIRRDWKKVNYAAEPYVEAMQTMTNITDPYYLDSGTEIVARFLCNAGSWRGDVARRVKAELNCMLDGKPVK